MHWLQSFFGFGSGDGNGSHYLFWSGAGSDLAYLTFLAAPFVYLRKVNCHVHHCWRVGRHLVEGTPYTVCRRHDPSGNVTAVDVRKRHHLYLGSKPGRG